MISCPSVWRFFAYLWRLICFCLTFLLFIVLYFQTKFIAILRYLTGLYVNLTWTINAESHVYELIMYR